MPTLEELREQLATEGLGVDSEPKADLRTTPQKQSDSLGGIPEDMELAEPTGVDLDALRRAGTTFKPMSGKHYVIDVKGVDALIKFGKHKGLQLSEIEAKSPSYLDWLATVPSGKMLVPAALKDVVERIRTKRFLARERREKAEAIGRIRGKKVKYVLDDVVDDPWESEPAEPKLEAMKAWVEETIEDIGVASGPMRPGDILKGE